MGTIINLIIIFIVVASVVKRFQELSKSGETIQKPRQETGSENPDHYETTMESYSNEDDREERFEEEYSPPLIPEPVKEQRPLLDRHSRTLEDILGKIKAAIPKDESIYSAPREIVTDSRQESVYNAPREIMTDSREEGAYSKQKPSEIFNYGREHGIIPQFGCNAVVKGLVMSEILGRPVSMKKPNEWW
jgi:hypothetical protein